MKSVMLKNWSHIPEIKCPRSIFNRSSGHKTMFNAGYLIPIFVDWALPADTWHMSPNYFARLGTPIVPVMDNLYLDTFWFAVPCRLLWDNWNKCMGEQDQEDILTPVDYLVPQMDWSENTVQPVYIQNGQLGDYFGLPTDKEGLTVSALPFRAYAKIYDDWFRDENLCPIATVSTGDGPDAPEDYPILRRGKRHDYFTSSLLWAQKGPGVLLPLGTTAPVIGNGKAIMIHNGAESGYLQMGTQGAFTGDLTFSKAGGGAQPAFGDALVQGAPTVNDKAVGLNTSYASGYSSGMIADLTNATAATINSLREAFQLQKMLERDARGGTRLSEIIQQHFGVYPPDFRLQRSEFLGSSSKRININPVAQTSGTPTYDSENPLTPQGNLAAYGVVSDDGGKWSKSFSEHMIIMGIAQVRADLNYQYGVNRLWLHRTRYDHYWPSLAHLGEQEVYNKEIWFEGTGGDGLDDDPFGYQERYAEYRYKPSIITSQLRSSYADPLDMWHFAEAFADRPTLNQAFIEDHTDDVLQRCLAVTSEGQILFDSYFDLKCIRPMPTYSVPGLIDHF